jgi:prepilin-type N-terminal cleavage/methylation domain-containing protein
MKKNTVRNKNGFTLVEVMIAMAVMAFGILSLVTVFTQGLVASNQTQVQYIAQQKAQEAMETIFTSRDTRLITWTQLGNISAGGIFKDGAQPLCAPGPDGLFGTSDDDLTTPDVVITAPGPDNIFGTSDDVGTNLNPWMTRTITFVPVANTPNLQSITVTVNWTSEGRAFQYSISSFISNFQ